MLENNAVLFVQKCNEMKSMNDYLSIKAICDEIYFYFFHMDVSVKGVKGAIDVYENSKQRLIDMENKSEEFIQSVDVLLKSLHGKNVLYFIIRANSCSLVADAGIDGVSEALDALSQIASDYDASISVYNTELTETRRLASNLSNHTSTEGVTSSILNVNE